MTMYAMLRKLETAGEVWNNISFLQVAREKRGNTDAFKVVVPQEKTYKFLTDDNADWKPGASGLKFTAGPQSAGRAASQLTRGHTRRDQARERPWRCGNPALAAAAGSPGGSSTSKGEARGPA